MMRALPIAVVTDPKVAALLPAVGTIVDFPVPVCIGSRYNAPPAAPSFTGAPTPVVPLDWHVDLNHPRIVRTEKIDGEDG